MATEHKAFDGCRIRCSHLGLDGIAWATHAWDDWYYCHVEGTWLNGNRADGVLCCEQASTLAGYVIRDRDGNPVRHVAEER